MYLLAFFCICLYLLVFACFCLYSLVLLALASPPTLSERSSVWESLQEHLYVNFTSTIMSLRQPLFSCGYLTSTRYLPNPPRQRPIHRPNTPVEPRWNPGGTPVESVKTRANRNGSRNLHFSDWNAPKRNQKHHQKSDSSKSSENQTNLALERQMSDFLSILEPFWEPFSMK